MGLDRSAGALLLAQSDAPGESRAAEIAVMAEICEAAGAIEVFVDRRSRGGRHVRAGAATVVPCHRGAWRDDARGRRCSGADYCPQLLAEMARHRHGARRRDPGGRPCRRRQHPPDHRLRRRTARRRAAGPSRFDEIMSAAIRLGGTITGEHGVGRAKKGNSPTSWARRDGAQPPRQGRPRPRRHPQPRRHPVAPGWVGIPIRTPEQDAPVSRCRTGGALAWSGARTTPPSEGPVMTTQHIETLIIGAGQAGLSTGYHLQRRGRPFLIVDGDAAGRRQLAAPVGHAAPLHAGEVRRPARPALPGRDPWHFPRQGRGRRLPRAVRAALRPAGADEHPGRPARGRAPTAAIVATVGDGHDHLRQRRGRHRHLRPHAVRAGVRRRPRPAHPAAALQRVPPSRPAAPGPVLVVGGSHSGMDIAYEFAETHDTILCGRDCGQIPVRPESRRAHVVLPVIVFMFKHVLTRRTPMGRKEMPEVRFHGGPSLRVKRRGPGEPRRRAGHQRGSSGSRAAGRCSTTAGGRRRDRRLVHRLPAVFDWIELPVFGDDGWPVEYRGVVDDAPGLYFCGLSFQFAFARWCSWASAGTPTSSPRRIVERSRTAAAVTA